MNQPLPSLPVGPQSPVSAGRRAGVVPASRIIRFEGLWCVGLALAFSISEKNLSLADSVWARSGACSNPAFLGALLVIGQRWMQTDKGGSFGLFSTSSPTWHC